MGVQTRVLTSALHSLSPGARVRHPDHGDGVVAEILPLDKRNEPYRIAFDNGESHQYSMQLAAEFIMDKDGLVCGHAGATSLTESRLTTESPTSTAYSWQPSSSQRRMAWCVLVDVHESNENMR